MSPPQGGRGSAKWTPFNYRRNATADRRPKPISVPIADFHSDNHSEASSSGHGSANPTSQPDAVRHATRSNEQYSGWNLYFPEDSMFALGCILIQIISLPIFISFRRRIKHWQQTESF